jgi:hypothetical protein
MTDRKRNFASCSLLATFDDDDNDTTDPVTAVVKVEDMAHNSLDKKENEDAEAVDINVLVDAPERPFPPTGVDYLIQQELMSGVSSMRIEKKIELTRLIALGGSVERSFALHFCARFEKLAEIKVILRLAGSQATQALNARNEDGETPLMIAAKTAASNILFAPPRSSPKETFCQELISLGADKDITDLSGLTALGLVRTHALQAVFCVGGYNGALKKLWGLSQTLMPSTGPTLADATVVTIDDAGAGIARRNAVQHDMYMGGGNRAAMGIFESSEESDEPSDGDY